MLLPAIRDRRPNDAAAWSPMVELEQVTQRLTRLLEQTMGPAWAGAWPDGSAFAPPADLEETDDAYVVEVELPGVDKRDVEVEVSGRRLTVSGERKERERTGVWRRRTRTVGRFHHEVVVPGDIDVEAVSAELADSVLTVTAPKVANERSRRRRVAVR